MGREIRMVPPHWDHPEGEDNYGRKRLQPMYDERFADAKREWIDGLIKWEAEGKSISAECEYWDYYGTPPEAQYYRPWKDEEATWFQLWETVSEGTPVSPPFETKDELAQYLAENGDYWDQERCLKPDWASLWGGIPGKSGWGIERARAFVNAGWAPSMISIGGKIIDGKLAL